MTPPTAPVIDPRGLTLAQLAGQRCVYANCRRRLSNDKTFVGSTPDSTPVFCCPDHEAVEWSGLDYADEIDGVTLVQLGFLRRRDVPVEERLSFQLRKAQLLTALAIRSGEQEEREVASAAWRRVRELHGERS